MSLFAHDDEIPAQKPHGATGHRARLRARLLDGGAEALADYEVLEYLLFGALARGDTKPAAKALLARFGTLAGVFNADPALLMQVKGVSEASAAMIRIAALSARRMATKISPSTSPILSANLASLTPMMPMLAA